MTNIENVNIDEKKLEIVGKLIDKVRTFEIDNDITVPSKNGTNYTFKKGLEYYIYSDETCDKTDIKYYRNIAKKAMMIALRDKDNYFELVNGSYEFKKKEVCVIYSDKMCSVVNEEDFIDIVSKAVLAEI